MFRQPLSYDPKFDALTLYESFHEEVLILSNAPVHLQVPNIDIRKRGASTQVATPPAVWFKKDVGYYLDRASEICARNKAALKRSYLPAPYSPCILESEADIVRSAALWLLHPVIIALQSEFKSVGCYAEVTIDDCRCDALIKINGETMVVLEYKNRGHIKMSEFEEGLITDPSYSNRVNILSTINDVQQDDDQSAMGHNAVCLTKQAAAYSTKWKTRYVGLFDWDNFFLWHFAGKDFRPRRVGTSTTVGHDGHATWAYGTPVRRRDDYRKALLGFILEAFQDRNNAKFAQPREPPFELSPQQKAKKRAEAEERRRQQLNAQQASNANVYGRRG
ncbi:hypothetical protein N8I77_005419 [Diaporthe amygdali]|uniref:Uncharacterized protein n=1 Tax=Phomopsis amygdali TaxID=1214568 RepID=A0AAD9SG30_PHOAM|nr:hypothetical protein N8I77_005419 [Diaporthe amygdali]